MSRTARALTYPHRYLEVARTVRRARAVPANATFGQAYSFAREIGITQQDEEIEWLFDLVRAERPRRVLEIGVDEGGTLFLWSRAAAQDAHLIAIDTRPPGPLGLMSPFPLVRRGFAHSQQRIELLLGTDSHRVETHARVKSLLGDEQVDFLFVDGDHRHEGVWADFRMYSPLVRKGGLVAFHDVSQTPDVSTEGVASFWREFTAQYETDERVVGTSPGFGIGIYRVPS